MEALNLSEFFIDITLMEDSNSSEFEFAMGALCNLAGGNPISLIKLDETFQKVILQNLKCLEKGLMSTQKVTLTHTLGCLLFIQSHFSAEAALLEFIKSTQIQRRLSDLKGIFRINPA